MTVERVAMVSPEFYGAAMVGGLGMAVHGLAKALKGKGVDVRVLIPNYTCSVYDYEKFFGPHVRGLRDNFATQDPKPILSKSLTIDGIDVRIVTGIDTQGIYTYQNSELRPTITDAAYKRSTKAGFLVAKAFSAFAASGLQQMAEEEEWVPDVIHLHEWQSALVAHEKDTFELLRPVPVVLTTHNAHYIGEVPFEVERSTGEERVDHDIDRRLPQLRQFVAALSLGDEYFSSLLEAGAFFGDAVNTVSTTYARNVLEGRTDTNRRVVNRLKGKAEEGLVGILNGIDVELMNPEKDPWINKFNAGDMESVAYGKGLNKLKLRSLVGGFQDDADSMYVTFLSRMAKQKGIVEILGAVKALQEIPGIRLFIIGEPESAEIRQAAENVRKSSSILSGCFYFAKPEQQHIALAGSDAILLPSCYEPCGLVPLEGMRYGAVPITSRVDGLCDTMVPFDGENGYSIPVKQVTGKGIVRALNEASDLFKNKEKWRVAVRNALDADFSWSGVNDGVGKYLALYEKARQSKTAIREA